MNAAEKICEKYKVEYNLMPDRWMRPICLTFGSKVPNGLQQDVMLRLDRLGIFTDSMGVPVRLDVSADREDIYTLSSGNKQFHFAPYTVGIPFVNYDMTEAIIWTVYIIACRKDWLDAHNNRFISCRCFSARQQAAAMRIAKSVSAQYSSSVPVDKVDSIFREMQGAIDPFAMMAPRFSQRPIPEAAFQRLHGRQLDIPLGDLAEALFGTDSFEQELDAFCANVTSGRGYRKRVNEAAQQLVETVYGLPIMSVGFFFTELTNRIDDIQSNFTAEIQQMFREKAMRFSLTADNLRSRFAGVDRVYLACVKGKLLREFLHTVCEQVKAIIDQEFYAAKKEIMMLGYSMGKFCFVREGSFENPEDFDNLLTWKKLAALEDSDIRSRDISWTPTSLSDLQSEINTVQAPQVWMCSERLKNLSDAHAITDAFQTRAVPVLDERFVWAIWADVNV